MLKCQLDLKPAANIHIHVSYNYVIYSHIASLLAKPFTSKENSTQLSISSIKGQRYFLCAVQILLMVFYLPHILSNSSHGGKQFLMHERLDGIRFLEHKMQYYVWDFLVTVTFLGANYKSILFP